MVGQGRKDGAVERGFVRMGRTAQVEGRDAGRPRTLHSAGPGVVANDDAHIRVQLSGHASIQDSLHRRPRMGSKDAQTQTLCPIRFTAFEAKTPAIVRAHSNSSPQSLESVWHLFKEARCYSTL